MWSETYRSLSITGYTLLRVLLDLEGASNNVKNSRMRHYQGGNEFKRRPIRGISQGGVISKFLWKWVLQPKLVQFLGPLLPSYGPYYCAKQYIGNRNVIEKVQSLAAIEITGVIQSILQVALRLTNARTNYIRYSSQGRLQTEINQVMEARTPVLYRK